MRAREPQEGERGAAPPEPPAMNDLKALMLRGPRLTLAVAESLTSGRLQARIGAISGASEFFLGGVTAYSLDEKVRHLGIDRAEACAVNSVSARVAEQMARGACVLFGADLGVATTGYAEPSAEWNVAEPFAWWGLARLQPRGGFAASGIPPLASPGRPSTRSSGGSGGQLLHVRHERLNLGGRGDPVAVEQLGHRVGGVVEGEIGWIVALDMPGLDRGPGEEPDRPRVDEDGRDEGRRAVVLVLSRFRPGDRLRVDPDVEPAREEQARRRVVGDDEYGLDRLGPGLQAQARLARVDQDRDAPAPVRPLHHQYAVAVLDAEDEPGLELAQDHDASRLPPHGRGDRGFGGRHELPKDGLARLDADDQVGPRRMGITGARLG